MALFLGIDLGTSYFKVGLFDEGGALRGLGRVATAPDVPAPGRCELPVDAFWLRLRGALAEALRQAEAHPRDIAALSYASQANSFVLLDAEDRALTPLVLWPDRRGGAVDPALRALARGAEFYATAGVGSFSPESAANKWLWLQRREPDLWARARRVATISDYFTRTLTGMNAGDAGTASLLGLLDVGRCAWSPAALSACGVEPGRLAVPLPPGNRCGRTTEAAATLLGVPAGRPFAVGGLDHQVAALGAGVGVFADVGLSLGTVLAAICPADQIDSHHGCHHGVHGIGARYYRLAFDTAGAGRLEEFRRRVSPELPMERLLALAAEAHAARPAQAGAPGTAAAPPQGGEADFSGDPGRVVHRILEEIALTQHGLIRRVEPHRAVATVAAMGGGARSAFWLGLAADVLRARLVMPACTECACLGAAAFAAVAAGTFHDPAEAQRAMVRAQRTFEPGPGNASAGA